MSARRKQLSLFMANGNLSSQIPNDPSNLQIRQLIQWTVKLVKWKGMRAHVYCGRLVTDTTVVRCGWCGQTSVGSREGGIEVAVECQFKTGVWNRNRRDYILNILYMIEFSLKRDSIPSTWEHNMLFSWIYQGPFQIFANHSKCFSKTLDFAIGCKFRAQWSHFGANYSKPPSSNLLPNYRLHPFHLTRSY